MSNNIELSLGACLLREPHSNSSLFKLILLFAAFLQHLIDKVYNTSHSKLNTFIEVSYGI
jgi:hypothetical protein